MKTRPIEILYRSNFMKKAKKLMTLFLFSVGPFCSSSAIENVEIDETFDLIDVAEESSSGYKRRRSCDCSDRSHRSDRSSDSSRSSNSDRSCSSQSGCYFSRPRCPCPRSRSSSSSSSSSSDESFTSGRSGFVDGQRQVNRQRKQIKNRKKINNNRNSLL
jgi:hypothetical protein